MFKDFYWSDTFENFSDVSLEAEEIQLVCFSHLQKLVGCKHSDSDGVQRHQCEHVALVVVVGLELVSFQLLLHQLLHLLHVLSGLRSPGAVHGHGLTSDSAWTRTCCQKSETTWSFIHSSDDDLEKSELASELGFVSTALKEKAPKNFSYHVTLVWDVVFLSYLELGTFSVLLSGLGAYTDLFFCVICFYVNQLNQHFSFWFWEFKKLVINLLPTHIDI